jgi:hypothetical protein
MKNKVYELWYNENNSKSTLFEQDNEDVRKLLNSKDKIVIKFEASSVDEAIIKMYEFLKIFKK